jgi:hypothetical protein
VAHGRLERLIRTARYAPSGRNGQPVRWLVISGREQVRAIAGPQAILVTPGVRSSGVEIGDQKRTATPSDAIRNGATVALLIATAVVLFLELRTPRWSLPRVLYIVGIAVMVGLALRPRSLFLFVVIWTSQHWILATGLASRTPSGEPAPRPGVIRGLFHKLNIRPWAVLLFLTVLSDVLLPLFEVEANRQTGT